MILKKAHIALLVTLSVLIGSGCQREELSSGGMITLTLATGEPVTKAAPGDGIPSDGGGIHMLGENRPDLFIALAGSNGTILATYPSGENDTYQSHCNSSSAKEATISINSPGRGTYSVFVVANHSWLNGSTNPGLSAALSSTSTLADLEALLLSRTASLTFDTEHPMPLSARGTLVLAASENGQINLELKRVVARVSLSFSNKTEENLELEGCTITLKKMNPVKGYLFPAATDYVTREESDQDDLVLCEDTKITIEAGKENGTSSVLVFPSIAPTQTEGGRMYRCDIRFTLNGVAYNNTDLPVQDLSTFESILALERNQSLTILTEINKRGSDKDISFNFRVRGWEKLTEEVTFN